MTVITLGAKNEAEMIKLAETLDKAGKSYALWREHPENICTALATKVRVVRSRQCSPDVPPYPYSIVTANQYSMSPII